MIAEVAFPFSNRRGVYAFRGNQRATFDRFTMLIPGTSGENVKDFDLAVGDDSPTGTFTPLEKFQTQNIKLFGTPYQEFRFNPVTAKCLRVRILSEWGGNNWFPCVYEFQLFGRIE